MHLNPSSIPAAAALIAAILCLEWVAARRLGLERAGAAFAAVGLAGSGVALLVAQSGAGRAAGSLAGIGPTGFDLVAVGTVLVAAGAIAWARARARVADSAEARADERAGELSRAIGFALIVAAVTLVLARRGMPERAFQLALPQTEGLRIPWLAAPIAALALAGLASPTGRLRARGAIAITSSVLALIAVGAPGFHGLAAVVGESAGWVALVAAFAASGGLALLAGDALENAPRAARLAGGLAFAALVALSISQPLGSGAPLGGEPDDELVVFTERPAERVVGSTSVGGRVRADVGADELRLVITPLALEGASSRVLALELGTTTDGWRSFASGPVDLDSIPPGLCRFGIEILRRRPDGVLTTIGQRTASIAQVGHGRPRLLFGFAIGAAFAALFVLPGTRWRWLAAVLSAACSLLALRS